MTVSFSSNFTDEDDPEQLARIGRPFDPAMPAITVPAVKSAPPAPKDSVQPASSSPTTDPNAPIEPPTTRIGRPSATPAAPSPLSVRTQRDEQKLAESEASGSGISRLPGYARIPLRILEGIGSAIAPATASLIPGTELHHRAQIDTQRSNVAEDVAEGEKEATSTKDIAQANAADRNDLLARAALAKGFTISYDAAGNPELTPIPGFPHTGSAGSAEEQTFASLLNQVNPDTGKNYTAIEAYAKTKQTAQDVKPEPHLPVGEGTAKQYNDAILLELNVNPKTAAKQLPPAYKVLPTDTDAQAKEKIQQAKDLVSGATGQQRIFVQTGNTSNARSDKSYEKNSGRLDVMRKPVADASARIGRLLDTLNQKNPQADALVGPELLTVMAGGQGSGLRLNEAEITRVVGGRSAWEDLKAKFQHWSTNPEDARSITAAQDTQIRALVELVHNKLVAKQKIITDAEDALLDSENPQDHRRIVTEAQQKLDAIDGGGSSEQQGGTVNPGGKPLTQDEAMQYVQKAGGDKNKARALAKADGRSF